MRRSLHFVLVALLALRGLLGDAMAMGLAPMAHVAAAGPTVSAGHTAHAHEGTAALAHDHGAPHADPSHHAASAPDCAEDQNCHSGPDGHSGTCSACGICHSAWHAPQPLVMAHSPAAGTLRPAPTARFASTPVSRVTKPPIA